MLTRATLTKLTKTLDPSAEQLQLEKGVTGGFTTEPIDGERFTLFEAGSTLCYINTDVVKRLVLQGHNATCKGIWIFETHNNTYLLEEI